LRDLPEAARCFHICEASFGDRATEFKQRCTGLGIKGVSLHSYRYAWQSKVSIFARFSSICHERKAVEAPPPRRSRRLGMLPPAARPNGSCGFWRSWTGFVNIGLGTGFCRVGSVNFIGVINPIEKPIPRTFECRLDFREHGQAGKIHTTLDGLNIPSTDLRQFSQPFLCQTALPAKCATFFPSFFL